MNFEELGANLGLDEDEYRELIELFINSGAVDLDSLQAALLVNDTDRAMRSAHTIKGASGNLGLLELYETSGIIEEGAANHHLGGLSEAVERLKSQFEDLRAFART